jgi:hypothetical protein
VKGDDSGGRAIERLLRGTPGDAGAAESASCLDAETLAAWMDGGLDDRAMMMAEAHASGCARCQALVGVMTRSVPESPVPEPRWRRDWNLRWLVPLSAGAAAIALWMVVPGERSASPPQSPQQQAESQALAERPESPTLTAPQSDQRALAPPPPAEQPQAQGAAAKRERRDEPATAGSAAKEQSANARKAAETAGRGAIDQLARDAKTETAREQAKGRVAATPPPAAAAPTATFRTGQTPEQLQRRLSANETREVVSPDPAVRWRLSGAGVVEYSTNGGATWEPLSTGISARLTAGSSPSSSVCWLVGGDGVVLLTTDGRRWQRLPFPETADLATVQAIDARRATITAGDGRMFRTENAGQTWTRVAPQY